MQTIIKKWGNSLAIRIPGSYAKDSGMSDGAEVDISMENGTIYIKRIKPTKKNYILSDLLNEVNEKNIHNEIETGEIMGQETW
jgi:antitoxin MazE